MGTTTATRRALLEQAWDTQDALENPDLRSELKRREAVVLKILAGGSLRSVSANGRTSEWSQYGPGNITHAQVAEAYRELIDAYGEARKFLKWCATYALDAFEAERQDLTTGDVVDPAVTIESLRWEEVCDEFGQEVDDVVGKVVNDRTIFLWMMYTLEPVTEIRSDRSSMRTASGGWRL